MKRSITALVGTAVAAAIVVSLLAPRPAMAGALSVMGDNFEQEATRVAGALLIVILVFAFLPDITRRNFPGLLIGFAAFCVGVFMVTTPDRAVGLAKNINNTVTHGAASGSGGGGSKLPDPGAGGSSGP